MMIDAKCWVINLKTKESTKIKYSNSYQDFYDIWEYSAVLKVNSKEVITKFDIEHTIPRSRSLDNSQVNKTLCCAIYNRQTKKDKIPFECENHVDILPRIKHWYARYKSIEDQIKDLSKKVKAASTKDRKDK